MAAPVFAKIAAGAMRILNVPPDNEAHTHDQISMQYRLPELNLPGIRGEL